MTKLCKVYILSLSFHYLITAEICSNLTDPGNKEIRNQVQMEVNNYKLYQQYMDIPQSFISLYLGPISGQWGPEFWLPVFYLHLSYFLDQGRKPLMVLPFLGHIVSGVLTILNIQFTQWDARQATNYLQMTLKWQSQLHTSLWNSNDQNASLNGYFCT